VTSIGEVADFFYLIIRGSVSVQIPNPEIKKWDILRKDYLRLKAWKEEEFDPKMKKAKTEAENTYESVDEQ
jgi:hypothetical protein